MVLSWLLFLAFLVAFWSHFYTVACLVVFPAIVIVRRRIPAPQLSVLERRFSNIAAVVIIVSFPIIMLQDVAMFALSPVLVIIEKIVGTILLLAYGIFTDYSKFGHLHDTSA